MATYNFDTQPITQHTRYSGGNTSTASGQTTSPFSYGGTDAQSAWGSFGLDSNTGQSVLDLYNLKYNPGINQSVLMPSGGNYANPYSGATYAKGSNEANYLDYLRGEIGTGNQSKIRVGQNQYYSTTDGVPLTPVNGPVVDGWGTPSAYGLPNFPYGNAYGDVEGVTNALADQVFGNYGQYANQALQGMGDAFNNANNLLGGEYTDRYNSYNNLLDELNAKLNAGYAEMQSYMPGAQAAADAAYGNIANLNPLLAEQQNAYYDMGRDMEALRAAYQNVLNGTVPEETKANLEQIYANQMGQASTALNEQYNKDLASLVDNLGGRGILSSTTSSQAQTGLNENLMRELQNAEYEYGTQKLQELIATPYKQFDAATQLYNSSGQLVSAAGDVLNGGLGIQNAYNQNANNYLGLANQANSNYNSLINSANSQASYGRSSLDALMNQINAYTNQANTANNIYTNVTNPAMDMWSQLLGNETSRLTSAQASGGGGSDNSGLIQAGLNLLPSIIDML